MAEENKSVKDLESAINSNTLASDRNSSVESAEHAKMSLAEEITFHKGALTTLVNERNELVKIVANVEKIMQAHLSRLKELGVEF